MNEVVDSSQRAQALDVSGSFIVQAPAGSGKTELLTQRYLVLLGTVEKPEEIIAITFTRKAASEMRNRVLSALDKVNSQVELVSEHEKNTWQLAQAVIVRDQQLDWQLLDNPNRLRIQTIDSLCASITRQMPITSRFGAQPEIADNPSVLYQQAARETIAEVESKESWSEPLAHLLSYLDNNLKSIEKLLAAMLARRDHWLRHVAGGDQYGSKRDELESAINNAVNDEMTLLAEQFPFELAEEMISLVGFAASQLKLTKGEDSPLIDCLDLAELPEFTAENVTVWQGIAYLFLTTQGTWRKTANATIGFPAATKIKDKQQKAHYQAMKQRFTQFVEHCAANYGFTKQLHDVRSLPPSYYRDDQWEIMDALFALLPLAVAQLKLIFNQHGCVDFTEVSQAAVTALGFSDQPSDLALALDYRIQHILIDEFQDTSLSQYKLTEQLTAGWVEGDGRTLFVVGDPMQSIYRFREAEVGLFLRAQHQGIGNVHLQSLNLTVNFRSQAGIVDWVNRSFQKIFPQREDIAMGAVSYVTSNAFNENKNTQAVQMHCLFSNNVSLEAERVQQLVSQAREENPQGTIAILVRSRGHASAILPTLKKVGLNYQAMEIERMGQRPVIQDLLALTRSLLHPGDRVSWLATLRAPWCGLSLADLTQLCGDDHYKTLWSQINNKDSVSQLSEPGKIRLTRLTEVFKVALAQRNRLSLRRYVEGVWLVLGGPAVVDNETDLEDAAVYFSLLDQLEQGQTLTDFEQLMNKVEQLFARPNIEADQRLQVMTIHKSKGLEFDTVIVPGLGRKPTGHEKRLLLWMERPREQQQTDLLMAPITSPGREDDAIYCYLKQLDEQKALLEDARLLYVAATRAKQVLHLIGHTDLKQEDEDVQIAAPHPKSLLSRLWVVVKEQFNSEFRTEYIANSAMAAGEDPINTEHQDVITRLVTDWQPPDVPPMILTETLKNTLEEESENLEYDWARESTKHVGSIVHGFLETIGNEGIQYWDFARVLQKKAVIRSSLMQLGVGHPDLDPSVQRVIDALLNVLSEPRGRWIFDAKHTAAACEYALTGTINQRLVSIVIDRTFIDDQGIRWIIDYKTSTHEGGGLQAFLDSEVERYQSQLARYATLFSMLENRPIRLGLYFPLLKEWREWAGEPAQLHEEFIEDIG